MAVPIEFKPKSVDPKLELQNRLAAAPQQHAEALLVAYDLLEAAHREGVLDALHGAIGAKTTILQLLSGYAADPESTRAVRTLLALGRLLGTLNPDPISNLSKERMNEREQHRGAAPVPSLWELFKRVRQPEARRGLALFTSILAALGRAAE